MSSPGISTVSLPDLPGRFRVVKGCLMQPGKDNHTTNVVYFVGGHMAEIRSAFAAISRAHTAVWYEQAGVFVVTIPRRLIADQRGITKQVKSMLLTATA